MVVVYLVSSPLYIGYISILDMILHWTKIIKSLLISDESSDDEMLFVAFQELQHLFNKLDVDHDGRVSFQEFLHGLFQHGGPSPGPATPVRPLSTPRHKLRLAPGGTVNFEERTHTPSYFGLGSGFFSALDVDNSGSENIIVFMTFILSFF